MKSDAQTDLLLCYCAGKLDRETAQSLEAHMHGCAECVRFRDSQRAVWKALDAWEAMPVSSDFDRRLYARIDAADATPWYLRWLDAMRPVFAQPAWALGSAVLVIAAGFVMDHPGKYIGKYPGKLPSTVGALASPHRSATFKVSSTEAEQVEQTLDDLEMLRQFDVNSDQKTEDKEKTSKSM